ncbi:MAG: glycine--tRNA ligase subunit beta, partial [Parvularculaceae bacterium]
LTARLSDAFFMYRQDLKIALSEQAKKLDKIVFFEGLGTLGDKVKRMAQLAREIAPQVGADPDLAEQAAKLAKADLVTGMVAEFPKLQGVMGRYYALQQGLDPAIADAIRDHYKPAGENDTVPTAPVSIALALAEKIDTLTGFWAINKKPTGSKDPFALRRAALGVIQIVLANKLRLPLHSLNVTPDLLSFFHDRLSVYLKDKNHQYDHINAVLLRPDGALEDDLVLIVNKLTALEAFLKTQDGTNLSAAYKRATNILKAEQKKSGPIKDSDVRAKLLTANEEIALHAALEKVSSAVQKDCAAENFAAAMAQLSTLRGPLDAFFEAVKVNDEDAGVRVNRLALLTGIKQICDGVADLGEVES